MALSRDRFLVKLTASRALKEKLELARDLMSHGNPSGDLAVVIERALDRLLVELEKKKLGRTARSDGKRMSRSTAPRPAKRTHVASRTRREIVAEDGLQCSFLAPDGHRCKTRAFLEFEHVVPKGRGGGSEPHNVRIFCRTHNRLAAERVYGKAHVLLKIATSRAEGRGLADTDASPKAAMSGEESERFGTEDASRGLAMSPARPGKRGLVDESLVELAD